MNEDRFADALDDMVNGKSQTSPEALATFASDLQGQEDEQMPAERRTAIWKDLMTAHVHDTPKTTGGAGPLSQPTLTDTLAFHPWVGRRYPQAPKRTRIGMINLGFQVGVTALAVVAIIIAAFAAFPIIRGERGPEITPTAFAAVPTTSAPTGRADMLMMSATQALPGTLEDANSWLVPVQAWECSALSASPPASDERINQSTYEEGTTPGPMDAEAVARQAREYEACGPSLGSKRSPGEGYGGRIPLRDRWATFFNTTSGGNTSRNVMIERQLELSKSISSLLPEQAASSYIIATDEPLTLVPEPVFLPEQAVLLSDGRIAIPTSYLVPKDHAIDEWPQPTDASLATIIHVFRKDSTSWLLDELLPWGCIGDCTGVWEDLERAILPPGDLPPDALPPVSPVASPATPLPAKPEPAATAGDNPTRAPLPTITPIPWFPDPPVIDPGPSRPVQPGASPWPFTPATFPPILPQPGILPATPPTPTVFYRRPQAIDCKVEPLTVDEVMGILEGVSSGRGESIDGPRDSLFIDKETYNALAALQREWLACRIHGSPFQIWALESDEMIRSELRQMYFPHYNMDGIRQDLVQMRSELSDADANTGFTWDPPEGTYLPMVPEYEAASLAMTGRAELLIVWMNREGDVITVPTNDDGAPVRSLESDLPNLWTFVWDEGSGTWLIDGYGIRCGQTFGP